LAEYGSIFLVALHPRAYLPLAATWRHADARCGRQRVRLHVIEKRAAAAARAHRVHASQALPCAV
jgi:hypothetical protein